MTRIGAAAAAALCCCVSTAAAEPVLVALDPWGGSDGAISADGRHIVASSRRGGASVLWMFDIAGQAWSQVTDGKGEDSEPSWSPDGRHAVFVSKRDGATDLWIVDVETRALTRLTRDDADAEYPSWSPDGSSIVYTAGPWGKRNFYVIPAAGGTSRGVLQNTGNVGACSFSADSAYLICHTYEDTWGDLIEVDIRSGERRRLTADNRWYYKPVESPDRRLLAFTDIGEDGDRVRLMPRLAETATPFPAPSFSGRWPMFAKGGAELFFHRVVDDGVELKLYDRQRKTAEIVRVGNWIPGRASLSRDGGEIAYCATEAQGDRSAVFIYNVALRSARRLFASMDACFPEWSPDGSRLALTVRQGQRWQIAVSAPDGRDLKILTAANSNYRQLNGPLSWSPDGRRLTFAAVTRPYELNVFVADVDSGVVENVTNDAHYDEGPSFSPDGASIVFMSTRGGDWTWGLFSLRLEDLTISKILEPGKIERRFPLLRSNDELWWVETDPCLSTTFLVRRGRADKRDVLTETAGVQWFEFGADGRLLLVTAMARRTEYWTVDLGNSP